MSRQFGFVGFRTTEEAEHAVKYFNRTFVGTARIAVEFAEKYGSSGLLRPWSKYSEVRPCLCFARSGEACCSKDQKV